MDSLESKNLLLTGSRHILVSNQLALITSKTEKSINKLTDLTKPNVIKIALGEPKSVPAGQYGEEVLKFYKILDQGNKLPKEKTYIVKSFGKRRSLFYV